MSEDNRRKTQEKPQDDQAKSGKKGKAKDFIRRHPVLTGCICVALVAALAGGVIWWIIQRHYETTDDAFIDSRQFAVAPKVSGYIIDVPVTDNQHVAAGAVLFRIDPRDYRIALEQAQARVDSSLADINSIDARIAAQKAQIEEAEAQVEQTKSALKFAERNAKRYAELARIKAGTVQQEQKTSSELAQQQANLADAKAKVVAAKRESLSLQAQRASGMASMAEAQAQLDKAKLDLSYTTITAAQAGRIVQLSAAVGQFTEPGQNLSMFVPDEIWVTANFKETQITDIRPGQPVDIEIDAYPDLDLRGHVDSIQPGSGTAFSLLPAENATGNFVKVVQRVPVKITIDNPPSDLPLGPGMSVEPRVKVR